LNHSDFTGIRFSPYARVLYLLFVCLFIHTKDILIVIQKILKTNSCQSKRIWTCWVPNGKIMMNF